MYKTLLIISLTVIILSLNSCKNTSEEELNANANCDTVGTVYQSHIAKIISNNCVSCHGANSASLGGGLRLDSYENAKENIDLIIGAINHKSGFSPMPKNDSKLSACDISKFTAWKNSGLKQN